VDNEHLQYSSRETWSIGKDAETCSNSQFHPWVPPESRSDRWDGLKLYKVADRVDLGPLSQTAISSSSDGTSQAQQTPRLLSTKTTSPGSSRRPGLISRHQSAPDMSARTGGAEPYDLCESGWVLTIERGEGELETDVPKYLADNYGG
jgi:hypothetical protein